MAMAAAHRPLPDWQKLQIGMSAGVHELTRYQGKSTKAANDRWRNLIKSRRIVRRANRLGSPQAFVGPMKSIAGIILLFKVLQYTDPNPAVPTQLRPVLQPLCVGFEFYTQAVATCG